MPFANSAGLGRTSTIMKSVFFALIIAMTSSAVICQNFASGPFESTSFSFFAISSAADAAGIDTDTARTTMHIMISIFFIFFSSLS
jgi:hypothetical protein